MMTLIGALVVNLLVGLLFPPAVAFDCIGDCTSPMICYPLDGRCKCPPNMLWDIPSASCRLREGEPCNPYAPPECRSNTSCQVEGQVTRCRCGKGFLLRDGNGGCSLSFGQPCDPTKPNQDPCSSRFFLKCSIQQSTPGNGHSTGQCRCQGEGEDRIWDKDRQKCVSLVGSVCQLGDNSEDRLECVRHARCDPTSSGYGRCECEPGRDPSDDRTTCLLNHGQACDERTGMKCDKANKLLICGNDGKCGCEFYGQMFWDGQSCRMLAGEFCDLPSNSTQGGGQVVYKCVEDAICVPKRRSGSYHSTPPPTRGVCTCVQRKFPDKSGHCTPRRERGMGCTYAGDCATFLTCLVVENEAGMGTCDCEPHSFWDEESSSCVVRLGQSCALEGTRCPPNAICDEQSFCSCEDDFIPDYPTSSCVSRTTTRTFFHDHNTRSTTTTRPSTSAVSPSYSPPDLTDAQMDKIEFNTNSTAPTTTLASGTVTFLFILILFNFCIFA